MIDETETLKLLIEGEYQSPSEGSRFRIDYTDRTLIAITATGYRILLNFKDNQVNNMLAESIKFLQSLNSDGIRIGSIHGPAANDTLEIFLRNFSNSGGLGTYVAPLLKKLGKAEIFIPPNQNAAWIRYKS